MQNLNEGDYVTLNTNSDNTNGKTGKVVGVDDNSTGVRVLLDEGSYIIVAANQLTKQTFLSE